MANPIDAMFGRKTTPSNPPSQQTNSLPNQPSANSNSSFFDSNSKPSNQTASSSTSTTPTPAQNDIFSVTPTTSAPVQSPLKNSNSFLSFPPIVSSQPEPLLEGIQF